MGLPYAPIRGLIGSDLFRRRDDVGVAPNPFDPDEETVVVKAINPDVGVFHGLKADRTGNVLLRWHPDNEDIVVARASRRVIVSVEDIVDEVSPRDPEGTYLPTLNVTAVVHAPGGAYPTGVPGRYDMDREHIMEYLQASASDGAFRAYLDKYVYGAAEAEHQKKAGVVVGV